MTEAKTLMKVRAANLKALVTAVGTQTKFEAMYGVNKNIISRSISQPFKYPVSVKLARNLEKLCGKPVGWMDMNHVMLAEGDPATNVNIELAAEAFVSIFDYLMEADIDPRKLNREAFISMTERTLATSMAYQGVDPSQIKDSLLLSSLQSLAH